MKTETEKTDNLAIKPKLRIQLLDESLRVIQDRLVDQAIEFSTGPKVSHTGPIRIETTLTCQQDIDSFKAYIESLRNGLKIKEVGKQGRKPNAVAELNSPREGILQEVENMVANGSNQDDVIKYLRTLGFVFLLTEDFLWYFENFPFKTKDIGEKSNSGQYLSSYSWMVRRIKMGKDPKTDKYDPQILFGFKMLGERHHHVVCYLYKERKQRMSIELPRKLGISFSNTEMTKFPKYMTEDERLKFSTEVRQLLTNNTKKPSKFFLRWYPDVIVPKANKEALAEAAQRK